MVVKIGKFERDFVGVIDVWGLIEVIVRKFGEREIEFVREVGVFGREVERSGEGRV